MLTGCNPFVVSLEAIFSFCSTDNFIKRLNLSEAHLLLKYQQDVYKNGIIYLSLLLTMNHVLFSHLAPHHLAFLDSGLDVVRSLDPFLQYCSTMFRRNAHQPWSLSVLFMLLLASVVYFALRNKLDELGVFTMV